MADRKKVKTVTIGDETRDISVNASNVDDLTTLIEDIISEKGLVQESEVSGMVTNVIQTGSFTVDGSKVSGAVAKATNADIATNVAASTTVNAATNAAHAVSADQATFAVNATNAGTASTTTFDSGGNNIANTYIKNIQPLNDNSGFTYNEGTGTKTIRISGGSSSQVPQGVSTPFTTESDGLVEAPGRNSSTNLILTSRGWKELGVGATSVFNTNQNGLVPAPGSGNTTKFLRGDHSWQPITIPEYSNFSTSSNGLTPASGSTSSSRILTGAGWKDISLSNYVSKTNSGGLDIGYGTRSTGTYTLTQGYYPSASGSYSHSEGYYTLAEGAYSHAEGDTTRSFGTESHAEGTRTTAAGERSHAEGSYTIAAGQGSHASGSEATALESYQTVLGTKAVGNALGMDVLINSFSFAYIGYDNGYFYFLANFAYNSDISPRPFVPSTEVISPSTAQSSGYEVQYANAKAMANNFMVSINNKTYRGLLLPLEATNMDYANTKRRVTVPSSWNRGVSSTYEQGFSHAYEDISYNRHLMSDIVLGSPWLKRDWCYWVDVSNTSQKTAYVARRYATITYTTTDYSTRYAYVTPMLKVSAEDAFKGGVFNLSSSNYPLVIGGNNPSGVSEVVSCVDKKGNIMLKGSHYTARGSIGSDKEVSFYLEDGAIYDLCYYAVNNSAIKEMARYTLIGAPTSATIETKAKPAAVKYSSSGSGGATLSVKATAGGGAYHTCYTLGSATNCTVRYEIRKVLGSFYDFDIEDR